MEGVGFGFVRLTRACVERMSEVAEHHFQDPINKDVHCPWLFEFAHDNGQRKSEDYIFCKRWRDIGGKVYLDPSLTLDHTGKKTYSGSILNVIKQQTEMAINNMPEYEKMQARAKQALGWR
jgi:hypothetical protein